MNDNKKMTEEEIDALVKKTMDEVMASITPVLEAKHADYKEKRTKDRAELDAEDGD